MCDLDENTTIWVLIKFWVKIMDGLGLFDGCMNGLDLILEFLMDYKWVNGFFFIDPL